MDKSKLIAIAKVRPFDAEYLVKEINKQFSTLDSLKEFIIALDTELNGHTIRPYDQPDYELLPLNTVNHCAVMVLKDRMKLRPCLADPVTYLDLQQTYRTWER